ncbi:MAG: hypothetical protein GX241_04315 [Ruminococcaceae bacterium]|nr:hypothetical protein [Oscillospiraceae bacterium]
MARKKKIKFTPDVIAIGAAAYVGSTVLQKVILAPKQKVKLKENFEVTVQGLLPFSQKYIAKITRVALNKMLPFSASALCSLAEIFHLKDKLRERTLWFVFEFLDHYSLNTFISSVLNKFSIFDREKSKDVLRELFQRLLTDKADRDAIIESLTGEVVNLLRLVSEGTLASMLFNDKFTAAAASTIATAIDRFLVDDAAGKFTDFFFRLFGQLEDVTISSIIINLVGLNREEFGVMLNSVYDTFLGDKMIKMVRDMKLGDVVYELLSSVDYDKVYEYMSRNMRNELASIGIVSTLASIYFFSGAKNFVFKVHSRRKKKLERELLKARKLEEKGILNSDIKSIEASLDVDDLELEEFESELENIETEEMETDDFKEDEFETDKLEVEDSEVEE